MALWRRKHKKCEVRDMGNDPLDPHGDGTIRPGDPMFDLLMQSNEPFLATRRPDGKWDIERSDEE